MHKGNSPSSTLYPKITHLNQVLDAIKPVERSFAIVRQNGLIFIKYRNMFNSVFPPFSQAKNSEELEQFKIRRECRGIVFRESDGKLVVRRFHKFFNLNERPECNVEHIDFTRSYMCLEKMDGSLIAPLEYQGVIRYVTMLGFTDQAKSVEEHLAMLHRDTVEQQRYDDFSRFCINNGMTALFEYLSAEHRIVIKYPHDELTLLSVRYNESGEYVPFEQVCNWAKEYNLPMVNKWDSEDLPQNGHTLIHRVKQMQGKEGCVLVFTDNYEMFKLKTLGYTVAHSMNPYRIKEQVIWKAIVNNVVDDLIAMMDFDELIRDCLQLFRDVIQSGIEDKANWISKCILKYERSNDPRSKKKIYNSLSYQDQVVMDSSIEEYTRFESSENDESKLITIVEKELERYITDHFTGKSRADFAATKKTLYSWLHIGLEKLAPFYFDKETGILKLRIDGLKKSDREQYSDLFEILEGTKKGKKLKSAKRAELDDLYVQTVDEDAKEEPAKREPDPLDLLLLEPAKTKQKQVKKSKSKKKKKKKK